MIIIPPYLKKGDIVGITCPAGFMTGEKLTTCIESLQSWGYKVVLGKTVGSNSTNYFSGSDEERTNDFQELLDNPEVKAILCGRGGYGSSRIIDQLNWKQFKKQPKWIIGFSDITVFHSHLYANYEIASIHGPMGAAFNNGGADNAYVQSLKKVLSGKKSPIEVTPKPLNRNGFGEGPLVGGNLSLMVHLIGTASEIKTKGRILFLEDLDEQIYHVDRMMLQLKRAGKLDKLVGLVIGGFSSMKDTERPFGKSVFETIADLVSEYKYPVCYDFPISHETANYAVKHGANYSLHVTDQGTKLFES